MTRFHFELIWCAGSGFSIECQVSVNSKQLAGNRAGLQKLLQRHLSLMKFECIETILCFECHSAIMILLKKKWFFTSGTGGHAPSLHQETCSILIWMFCGAAIKALFQVFGRYANLLCPDDERSMLRSGNHYIFVVGRRIKGIVLSLPLEKF